MGFAKSRIASFVREEDGNVESSLVLIPLLVLFLISAQLIVSINYRNIEQARAQSIATEQAIAGVADSSFDVETAESSLPFGEIRLLISRKVRDIPTLIPGLSQILGRPLQVDVQGVAVIEETR